jgi:hypothetical protein
MIKGKVDTKQFVRAMQEYSRATKKDEAEILNRAGRNIAFRAAQFTPITQPARIRAEMRNNNLAAKILAKRGKFKGVKISERKAIVDRMVKARERSARYIRVGWAAAIAAFGGKATRFKVNPKSEAAKGYGFKAMASRLVATLGNNSKGADKAGSNALQEAVDFVAKDMLGFAQRTLAKTAKQYSGK